MCSSMIAHCGRKFIVPSWLAVIILLMTFPTISDDHQLGAVRTASAVSSTSSRDQSVEPGNEILTVAFVMDSTVVHHIDAFNKIVRGPQAADAVYILGRDCAFAWDSIERWYPDDQYDQGLHYWRSSRHSAFTIADSLSGRHLGLFRADLGALIPRNATIIDAELHLCPASNMYVPRTDSLVAVLMTQPGDSCWYRHSALGVPQFGLHYLAHASWHRQIQGLDSGGYANRGYPEVSGAEWAPALTMRPYVWNWGKFWDYSRRPNDVVSSSIDTMWTNYYANQHVRITVKNCVQAIVNGEVNNGIMWYGFGRASTASHTTMGWETSTPGSGSPAERTLAPWITVTYVVKPYVAPFPQGADWAFVFSTDDGYAVNTQYDSIFNPYDYHFTIGLEQFRVNGQNRLTAHQLIELHDRGDEIATHGYHPPEYAGQPTPDGSSTISTNFEGFNYYTQGGEIRNWYKGAPHFVLAAPGTTGYDSTCFQMDPVWLDSLALAEGRFDLPQSPRWGKGMHVPNAGYSIDMLRAIHDVGLSWVRTLPAAASYNPASGYVEYRRIPSTYPSAPGYAIADSVFLGQPHDQRARPMNMRMFPTTCDLRDIFGARDTHYTEAQVKLNLRRQIAKIRGNGQCVLAVVTHRQKSAAQDGLDLQEAGWMAEVVHEMGGAMVTWGEYADQLRSVARPISTPLSFGTGSRYKFASSDHQWYVRQYPFVYRDDDPSAVLGPNPPRGHAELVQNAPNPFNPKTAIRFNLVRPANVNLSVFDMRGRLVRTLASGAMSEGAHEVIWNGDDGNGRKVASGVYFCRFLADGLGETRKMTLVR